MEPTRKRGPAELQPLVSHPSTDETRYTPSDRSTRAVASGLFHSISTRSHNFFSTLKGHLTVLTSSAFSSLRQRISPIYFRLFSPPLANEARIQQRLSQMRDEMKIAAAFPPGRFNIQNKPSVYPWTSFMSECGLSLMHDVTAQEVGRVHSTLTQNQVAPSFRSGTKMWKPFRPQDDPSAPPVADRVLTTSERGQGKPGLPNLYIARSSNHTSITCGALATPLRRAQFMSFLHSQGLAQSTTRLAMHQLNSDVFLDFDHERESIRGQHEAVSEFNEQLPPSPNGTPHVLHTNNCMSFWAKAGLGSSSFNPEAYRTYLSWILEDGHQDLNLAQRLSTNPQEILSLANEAKAHGDLKTYRALHLVHMLLTNTSLSPSARVLVELALDREVGAVSQISCKSGLDRTGHMRALDSALDRLLEDKTLNPDDDSYLHFFESLDSALLALNKGEPVSENNEAYVRLQRYYFDEVQRVALPIIAVSSGVSGFKLAQAAGRPSLRGNDNLMPFFPATVIDASGKEVPLMVMKGNRRLFTQEGADLLQGASRVRGH